MIIAKQTYFFAACIAISLFISAVTPAACEDFEIDGVFEGAIDLPRILFLLKHSPQGQPLPEGEEFFTVSAYLDTGASGILLSREIADFMGITIDANGQFVDTGIGGDEYFDISEPLYIGTADYNSPTPQDANIYYLHGPWHFQINQEYVEDPLLEEPLNVIGVPVMAGRTVVLTPIRDFDIFDDNDIFSYNNNLNNNQVMDIWDDWGDDWNDLDFEFSLFYADIKDANDGNIPETDFQVALRFEKYISPSNPLNNSPLPVLAYNPVIDNMVVEYNGISSKGNWLFDTGAMVSIISYEQAMTLGLVDENGEPLVEPDFSVAIGGVGGQVELPGFILNKLSVPTLSGFNLVFLNARVCLADIAVWDEDLDDFVIIDGVFGSNFLCDSIDIMSLDISITPFENIVIDTQNGLLGFDVAPEYSVPSCRFTDLDGRCGVDFGDLAVFAASWLQTDCGVADGFCSGADITENGGVDWDDFYVFVSDWLIQDCQYPCGSEKRPYPAGDFTHDCCVNLDDLAVFAEEWLNSCNWLNFNCRDADLYRDGAVNFRDWTVFSDNW